MPGRPVPAAAAADDGLDPAAVGSNRREIVGGLDEAGELLAHAEDAVGKRQQERDQQHRVRSREHGDRARHSEGRVIMYGDIKLFAGSGCPLLAQKIADYIRIPLSGWDIIKFPNENLFVRLHGGVCEQDVFLIQSHNRPVHTNLL